MTHDRSAGEAVEKVCRSGSKAANNIVESSETKKVAILAIQNIGQGEVDSEGAGVTACQVSEALVLLPSDELVGFMIYIMIVLFLVFVMFLKCLPKCFVKNLEKCGR